MLVLQQYYCQLWCMICWYDTILFPVPKKLQSLPRQLLLMMRICTSLQLLRHLDQLELLLAVEHVSLSVVQISICAIKLHKLIMCAWFTHFATAQYTDLISISDSCQLVCYYHSCASLHRPCISVAVFILLLWDAYSTVSVLFISVHTAPTYTKYIRLEK
jgi:hypothetical protein